MRTFVCPAHPARRQRGAAALVVTMMLFFAMVLAAVFVNRNLVFEQRSAANQVRSTLALEAADAGLEWALAQLNNPQRIGADCLPTTDAAATSFRARYLAYAASTAIYTPVTWNAAGTPAALQASCVRGAGGWSCSCPAQGLPTLAAPAGATTAPAFTLQFLPVAKPGLVRIAATGCTSLAGACVAGAAAGAADASTRIEVAAGLFAGLRTPPAATVTTRGGFDAGSAPIGVHNADPASGVAIDAGAAIVAAQARLTLPAGAAAAGALVGNDTALAGLSAEQFFATYFGVDKARWKSKPAVTRLSCGSADCGAALAEAIAAAADHALIWIDGDLVLSGPLTLGSAQHPVVIVAGGSARLNDAVALHGVLYANGVRWDDTAGGGAYLRGALLSEAGYQGNGAPELAYDRGALDLLKSHSGSFARVSGSWRDF